MIHSMQLWSSVCENSLNPKETVKHTTVSRSRGLKCLLPHYTIRNRHWMEACKTAREFSISGVKTHSATNTTWEMSCKYGGWASQNLIKISVVGQNRNIHSTNSCAESRNVYRVTQRHSRCEAVSDPTLLFYWSDNNSQLSVKSGLWVVCSERRTVFDSVPVMHTRW